MNKTVLHNGPPSHMNDDTVPMGCESAIRYIMQSDGRIDPPPVAVRYIGRRRRSAWKDAIFVLVFVIGVAGFYALAAMSDSVAKP